MIKSDTTKKQYLQAFWIPLITAALILLPFVIEGKGILYVFTDFNLQQIPFNMLSNTAVKSGNIFWNWNTDLGSSFIGAYSFYTIGSPFFWLSSIFPAKFFPYLIAPLLMLKFAFAGLTSFAFLQRFTQNKNYALLGSLLYAFSSFQIGNLFYNHFLDVTALFPLLLIALEEFLVNEKFGLFAIAVAVNAFTNYEFFVGEAIFLIIYFFCRLSSREFRMPLKKWGILIFEALLGVGLSFVLLLPSALYTASIPRAGNLISGLKMFFYHPSVYLDIMKAFLMPAEAVNRSLITPTSWTSTEAYLPIFGTIPALAYLFSKRKRKDWLSLSIVIFLLISLIPVLNSMFYLFNAEYYSRWFYMLILLFVLASVKALEDPDIHMKHGIIATAVLWVLFIFVLFVANRHQPVIIQPKYLMVMLILVVLSFLCFWLLMRIKNKKIFFNTAIASVLLFAIVSGVFNIWADRKNFPDSATFTSSYLDSSKSVSLPSGDDYRVDTTNCYLNTNILLDKPSIDFFSSTVEGTISQFYNSIGISRINNSQPDYSLYELRPFLSVKYFVMLEKPNLPSVTYYDYSKLPNSVFYEKQGQFNIYSNKDYIPFGYTFDHAIQTDKFEKSKNEDKPFLLLRGLILTPQQMQKYSDLLPAMPDTQLNDFSQAAYSADIAARRNESSYYFSRNNTGFTSKINLSKPNLVFFSVPYDQGWTAAVNGKSVSIEKVDNGFMAVAAPAGDNTITFTFQPAGLKAGFIVTLISIALLIAYIISMWQIKKRITTPTDELGEKEKY